MYSVLLPCSTLAFALPFLGDFQEPIEKTTVVGLLVVLCGFYTYEAESFKKRNVASAPPTPLALPDAHTKPKERTKLVPKPTSQSPGPFQPSFHERLILPLPVRGRRNRALTEPVETAIIPPALRNLQLRTMHSAEHAPLPSDDPDVDDDALRRLSH